MSQVSKLPLCWLNFRLKLSLVGFSPDWQEFISLWSVLVFQHRLHHLFMRNKTVFKMRTISFALMVGVIEPLRQNWQPLKWYNDSLCCSLPLHSYFLSSPAHSGFSESAAAESSCLPRGRGVFSFKASCRLSDSAGLFSVSFYALHTTLHVRLLTYQVEARWTTVEILVRFTLSFVLPARWACCSMRNRATASKQTERIFEAGWSVWGVDYPEPLTA